ncbi:MAG TPA: hypothetical protein VFZ24_00625 [Longimicrobiales bacterium]
MAADVGVSPSRLVLGIGLFVLLGTPLVAYLWETLNRLFAGIIEPVRLLIAIPALAVFYVLLRFMARTVRAWDGRASSTREGG